MAAKSIKNGKMQRNMQSCKLHVRKIKVTNYYVMNQEFKFKTAQNSKNLRFNGHTMLCFSNHILL